MKTKRSAQVELVGLVIFVLLFAVGLLFVVINRATPPAHSFSDEYVYEELAFNFILASLKHDTSCGYTVEELVKDVIYNHNIGACGDTTPAVVLNETLSDLLNFSLRTWGYDYEYVIMFQDQEYFRYQQGCAAYQERPSAALQPLPIGGVNAKNIFVSLSLCYA
ncbi:MAG: hypothetical protein H6502_02055 [Candidatus Woesearchaeota archaeon]|nr:MAG: hypothetical protein H6502_02055 [Candidatus Woesearchaeota archaeon]